MLSEPHPITPSINNMPIKKKSCCVSKMTPYSFYRAIGLLSKVVHCKGNRVQFGTEPWSTLQTHSMHGPVFSLVVLRYIF